MTKVETSRQIENMLKEEIVKSCSGVSMTIGKQAFLFSPQSSYRDARMIDKEASKEKKETRAV